MITTRSMRASFFLAIFAVAAGCDSKLDQAIDDLRAAAPGSCKDYCEDKVTCEWEYATTSSLERDAFSGAVQRCEVGCAYDTGRGAYVAQNGTEAIEYVDHVSGAEIGDFLSCAAGANLFSCPDGVHTFGGLVESQCAQAETCLSALGIDLHLAWTPSMEGGGTCAYSGSQWLEAEYF